MCAAGATPRRTAALLLFPRQLTRSRCCVPPALLLSSSSAAAGLACAAVLSCPQSAQAISYDGLQGLTYLQVKGTGLANTCPVIEEGSTNLKDLKAGTYK
jgi:photosystem II oxygen-evolving enhancer protein 1